MTYVLGLDLGSNSIGWALVDEGSKTILRSGVRVFPEGVDRDKQGGEVSKNENRRIKRGMRRQIARRAARKKRLRKCLVEAGMWPADEAERTRLEGLDPWGLRARALDERLELFEIGRALVHLNQRRGFLSNRKTDKPDNEKSEMLAEISELQRQVEASGCRTLGEYLHKQRPAGTPERVRVRGKHTRRAMLIHEFNCIWEAQAKFHPTVMTEELRREVGDTKNGIIFFQRGLYGALVGECELEKGQRRCPRADRRAQKFRLYQEVNNLRVIDNDGVEWGFSDPDRKGLREKLVDFLSWREKAEFETIKSHLELLDGVRFNLERGKRKSMQGMVVDARVAREELFGEGWWARNEGQRDAIVRSLLKDDEATVREKAMLEWGLSDEAAERVAGFNDFPPGYIEYSLRAVEKLLPHVEAGLPLTAEEGKACALVAAGYLPPHMRAVKVLDFLGQPPDLANPIVGHALHQVRQVVNAIVREYGKPEAIHIELAREVKGSAEKRAEEAGRMREREAERDAAADEIRKWGITVNRDAINRFLLWKEQGEECVYSGNPISQVELFSGAVNEDHILPRQRSLDNSLMNRVVCFREANDEKGQRTPYEWVAESDAERYEKVLQRAKRLPFGKYRKFLQKEVVLDDFIARQLVDTAYIARAVTQYVRQLGVDVLGSKGQLTGELRQKWGLNTVLRDDGLDLKNREDHRHHAVDAVVIALTDRRRLQGLAREAEFATPWPSFRLDVENSVNAINVSYRVERRVSGALHEETLYGPTAKPWKRGEEKRRDVDGKVEERPWATGWVEEAGTTVYRKPVETITEAMVEDIRDPVVRRIVGEAFERARVKRDELKALKDLRKSKRHTRDPRELQAEIKRTEAEVSEIWKLRMPGEDGAPIRKVRLIKRDETIVPIRSGRACVKTGSNHHVCIFELEENEKKKREAVFVSMMEAARRVRDKEPLIRQDHPTRNDARFVMSLSRGELVLGTFKGQERLCVFQTGASTQGQLYFALHTDARQSGEKVKFAVKANTLKARKVTVDPLGRMRWAND